MHMCSLSQFLANMQIQTNQRMRFRWRSGEKPLDTWVEESEQRVYWRPCKNKSRLPWDNKKKIIKSLFSVFHCLKVSHIYIRSLSRVYPPISSLIPSHLPLAPLFSKSLLPGFISSFWVWIIELNLYCLPELGGKLSIRRRAIHMWLHL